MKATQRRSSSSRLRTFGQSEPQIALDSLQGNIVPGFSKDHQWFLYYGLVDPQAGRRSLSELAHHVSSAAEVLAFNRLYRALRRRRGSEPGGLAATWVNLAFSFPGLTALLPANQLVGFRDEAFKIGLPTRSALIGDPPTTKEWVIGGPGNIPDLVVIVAADREEDASDTAREVDGLLAGWKQLHVDRGRVRPDLSGHEHFGFKDGISQPGMRGLASSQARDYITPRVLASSDQDAQLYAAPGQPLVWPGQFIFGYPTQDTVDPMAAGPVADQVPYWGRNGSYMVVRRLRQDVSAFNSFVKDLSGKCGLPADLVGAKLVGRWQSGAPVMRATSHDIPQLGSDRVAANDFAFAAAGMKHRYRRGIKVGDFPLSLADLNGNVCPHAAHIRKVNARDEGTDLGGLAKSMSMRILRRGVPFGPPFDPADQNSANVERGLIFVSYQTSIEEQFEQLTIDWVNSAILPKGGGFDPVIGQNGAGARGRTFEIVPGTSISITTEWVRSTGGGYFFAPPIDALSTTLGPTA